MSPWRAASLFALAVLVAAHSAVAEPIPSASGRLRFVPGPGARGLATTLSAGADEDRDAVIRDLGRDYDGVTEVRVALDPPAFRDLLPPGASVPDWAAGAAFPEANLVVLRSFPGAPDARAILRHELDHVAVGRLTQGRAPRWFLEGLATVRAGDAWSRQGPSLVRAALFGRIFRFQELTMAFPERALEAELAYAQSADFVSWLLERSDEAALQKLLRAVAGGMPFDAAVAATFGRGLDALEAEWSRSLSRWQMVALVATRTEIWWILLAALLALAALFVREKRRRLLEEMEIEEATREASVARLADGPATAADAAREALAEAEESAEPMEGPPDGEDEIPYFVSRAAPAAKKPTLH